jgi:hypothetical protein
MIVDSFTGDRSSHGQRPDFQRNTRDRARESRSVTFFDVTEKHRARFSPDFTQ